MKFCPKCGSLMLPKKTEKGQILACGKCGYTEKAEGLEEYKLVRTPEQKAEVAVIEGKAAPTLPSIRTNCPKCGHSKAYWWLRQTRGADEPTTRFLKCEKCSHVWREYA